MKNIAIVGYGAIGALHARGLRDVADVRLYAVCDISASACQKAKEDFAECRCYMDFDALLRDASVDSVHICTPHYLHFEMIRQALAAGKSVVTEKPVTMTKSEFDALLALKNAENVCVVFQNRWNPSVVKMKSCVGSGELGKLRAAKGILTWGRDMAYYRSAPWRGKLATEGGGVLINQAIHTLDLMITLGGDLVSVKGTAQNMTLPEIEVEDTVFAHLQFENGAKGVFFATNSYGRDIAPELELVFERGILTYREGKLYQNGILLADDRGEAIGKSCWGGGHQTLMKNYYEKGVFFNPFDVKNTMETVFAIYESAKNGGIQVWI